MYGRITRVLALAVTLAMVALVSAAGTQTASAKTISNEFGSMKVKRVTGESDNGATFKGQYDIKRFKDSNGTLMAVGKLTGELTKKNGKTKDVAGKVKMPVTVAGASAADGAAARSTSSAKKLAPASCEVLNLVLGPLDLDLLGLVVHLDRVVLNITAVPGAGNLLGNLLCAVAGLLDGTGLPTLNEIRANLLNSILGLLRL
jgi:hypothetical protein